jgi:hypothetical protein
MSVSYPEASALESALLLLLLSEPDLGLLWSCLPLL